MKSQNEHNAILIAFPKFVQTAIVIMETEIIREKLHRFIESVEDKRAEAIYTIFENEIEGDEWEYTPAFKAELDRRYEYYKSGGKMVSAEEADKQIFELLHAAENK